ADAYSKAFKTDPTSAFGGIIAFNTTVDVNAAQLVNKQFVEVLIAPDYTPEALAIFAEKQNIRVLSIDISDITENGKTDWEKSRNAYEIKRVGSGILLQNVDQHELTFNDLKIVTKKQPTQQQLNDMLFAWKIAHYTKSNAIVFCSNEMTLGVGAGQMSRIDSARIASIKAENAGLSLTGSVVASDAFFPFRDGLDVIVNAGATCIIQPGGSVRDQEVIDAADEHGVVMVFSGIRHFKH
ncbi:MAG: bifunctional phosphoribosylaminoimidazolecarboxamide formyltransferase/IMP cyclohydrolase, partial [Saezia sp.]